MCRSKLAREANYKDVGAADLFDQCAEGGYQSELLRALIAKNHCCAVHCYSSADFWVDLGVFWKAVSRMGGLCPPCSWCDFTGGTCPWGCPCDRNLTRNTKAFGICCVLVFPCQCEPSMPTLSHRSSASLPEPPAPLSYPKGNAHAPDVLYGAPWTQPPRCHRGQTDIADTKAAW